MGTIKKLYQDQLVGGSGGTGQEVYPVTSTLGVYDTDNNQLQGVLDKLTTNLGLFTCGTPAATAAKTVSASKFALMEGGSVKIKFTYANSAASPTLAIGTTAAKPIIFNGSAANASNSWGAGEIIEFFYDGTNWVGSSTSVSVSQNTSTGHTDITIGSTTTPVASVEEVNQLGQEIAEKCGGYYNLVPLGSYLVNNEKRAEYIKSILVNSVLSVSDGLLVLPQYSDDDVDYYSIEDPARWVSEGWQQIFASCNKPYLRIVVKKEDGTPLSSSDVCLITPEIYLSRQVFDLDNQKVDKVQGKGLSTNDFSDALKNKLVELPTSIQINSTIFKMVENATSALLSSGGLVWDNYRDKFAYAELSDTDGTYLGLVQESNYPPSQNDWDNIGGWSSSINSNIRQISSTYFRILIKRADGGNLTINDVYLINIKPSETNNEKVSALENKWTLNNVFHLFPNLSGNLMWTNAISSSEIEKFKESNLSVLDGTYTVLVQESSDGNTFVTPTGNDWSINVAKQFSTITEDYFRILIRKEDGTAIVNDGTVYIDNVKFSLYEKVVSLNSQWNNRQWFAFGTSMSDTSPWEGHAQPSGRYPKYLAALSGLYHNNWAVKGSMLAKGEDDPQRNSILKQIRIAAGLEPDGSGVTQNHLVNADLITIEGLINDYAHSSNLAQMGSIDDMNDSSADNQTIYGALYLAIKYCYEANPNARIVLITDTSGSTSGVRLIDKNGIGCYISDYAEAMLKAAQHMGCICIDAGSHSQIDMFHTQYLYDNLHHNDLGGEQYARTIWEELKNINPCVSQS